MVRSTTLVLAAVALLVRCEAASHGYAHRHLHRGVAANIPRSLEPATEEALDVAAAEVLAPRHVKLPSNEVVTTYVWVCDSTTLSISATTVTESSSASASPGLFAQATESVEAVGASATSPPEIIDDRSESSTDSESLDVVVVYTTVPVYPAPVESFKDIKNPASTTSSAQGSETEKAVSPEQTSFTFKFSDSGKSSVTNTFTAPQPLKSGSGYVSGTNSSNSTGDLVGAVFASVSPSVTTIINATVYVTVAPSSTDLLASAAPSVTTIINATVSVYASPSVSSSVRKLRTTGLPTHHAPMKTASPTTQKSSALSKMIIPSSTLRSVVSSSLALSKTTSSSTPTSSKVSNGPLSPAPQYSSVAVAAINALSPFYSTSNLQWTNVKGWEAANAYNDIMDFDHYTSGSQFASTYGVSLLSISTTPSLQGTVLSTDGFNDDQLWWCLAMLRAYQNYNHQELLDQTIKQWLAIGANAQVFKSDQGTKITKGGITRDAPIPSDCDVDGAVYWSSQADSNLNAISTSLYAQVGAWLYEITGDEKYRGPAESALNFLQRVMLDKSTGIMNVDSMTVANCQKNPGSLTYNTGTWIGALTSLHRKTGEANYLTLATQSVTSATTGAFSKEPSLVIDQQDDLVDTGDDVQWRDVLFRNILDFYVSNPDCDSGLKSDVQAFFKANFDAIQKVKFGGLYSANWFGLLNVGSDWGTASVLSALNGAMMILS